MEYSEAVRERREKVREYLREMGLIELHSVGSYDIAQVSSSFTVQEGQSTVPVFLVFIDGEDAGGFSSSLDGALLMAVAISNNAKSSIYEISRLAKLPEVQDPPPTEMVSAVTRAIRDVAEKHNPHDTFSERTDEMVREVLKIMEAGEE